MPIDCSRLGNYFVIKKFNMAAAKPEVVSNLEVNSVAEKFRISPILWDIFVAEIIADTQRQLRNSNWPTGNQK
jgi:GH35 family endo-1,4-beta-xylanase